MRTAPVPDRRPALSCLRPWKDPVLPRFLTLTAAGGLVLGLAGCAGDPAAPSATAPPSSADAPVGGDGHGAVTGASEVAEPQLGITTIDRSGAVAHLDLLDESVVGIGAIGAPSAMTTDGRYLFARTDAGVEVVDSGVWTWDHVDHFHYYRADPRVLGTVPGRGTATVATTNLSTTGGTGFFFADSGEAVLLDTAALSKGEVVEHFRIETEPHFGLVVPVGSFALVTGTDTGNDTGTGNRAAAVVRGYTADGEPTGLEEPCLDASGTITTRVGAVIGCRDGALLATLRDEELVVERIPYPQGANAPAATAFHNREGRPTVAALAGPDAIWLLDTRERSWALLRAPEPLVGVTAVDDEDENVLALAADGRVLVLDGASGALLAETDALVAESLAAGLAPTLIADQQRAYLSAPAERRLYEIDFADGARIARTFDTATEPVFAAETGR